MFSCLFNDKVAIIQNMLFSFLGVWIHSSLIAHPVQNCNLHEIKMGVFFSSEDKSMRKKHNRHQFKNVNEFLMPRNFLSKLGVFWIKRKRILPTDPRVVKVAVLLITVVLPSGVWKISLIRHITDRKTNETNKLMWMAFLWQCNLLKQKEIRKINNLLT